MAFIPVRNDTRRKKVFAKVLHLIKTPALTLPMRAGRGTGQSIINPSDTRFVIPISSVVNIDRLLQLVRKESIFAKRSLGIF